MCCIINDPLFIVILLIVGQLGNFIAFTRSWKITLRLFLLYIWIVCFKLFLRGSPKPTGNAVFLDSQDPFGLFVL